MSAAYAPPMSIEQLREEIAQLVSELQALERALAAEHTSAVDQLVERAAYVVRLEVALRLIRDMPAASSFLGNTITAREIARRALEAIPPTDGDS